MVRRGINEMLVALVLGRVFDGRGIVLYMLCTTGFLIDPVFGLLFNSVV